MLLPWEIKCNTIRTPMRSILIACVSALLVCGMALYLQNIQLAEEALDDLAQQMPVNVRVTNQDGYLHEGLSIQAEAVDYLLESGVRDPVYTSAAIFTAEPVGGIYGTNTLASLDGLSGSDFTFADGWDESFPACGEGVVALREDIAARNGWQLGDEIFLEFSMLTNLAELEDPEIEPDIQEVGDHSVTLIATYPGIWTVKAIMPVDWLRTIADNNLPKEKRFTYDSFHAVIEDPRELNAYKDQAERHLFAERSAVVNPGVEGRTLSIEDEMFIKTAGEMTESLNLYRTFLVPFFVLVTLIMAMVTFLALRSCRIQIAITSSLGRPKHLNAAAHFCSAVIVQMAGCLLALLVLALAMGLPPALAGITLGVFSLCALGGTALALVFLFRFDTLTLLTKDDT